MFSGSAVVDWNNTAGFQTGQRACARGHVHCGGKPFTQGLAYSNDRGRIWTKYEKNPVLGHIAAENRDPKVVWFAPEKKWVMSLYLDHNDFVIFGSTNLKHWDKLSDFKLQGDAECPNFFQMPLDGKTNDQRWVFFGANGVYSVGRFDGRKFIPETQPQRLHNGNCWYASQVFSDIPASDGRCILLPWGRLPDGEIFRGMTFNQMMGLPVELTLHSTSSGASLLVNPARELKSLRQTTHNIEPQTLHARNQSAGGNSWRPVRDRNRNRRGDAKEISFDLRGVPVVYNVATQKISCMGSQATLTSKDGKISLHIFVDRASVDIYGGGGTLYLPMAKALSAENKNLKLSCQDGDARIISFKVYQLKSAW